MTIIASYGFLEIIERGDTVIVSYGGNMGANLASVEECFNALYGSGAFSRVLPLGFSDGSPDYMWTLTIIGKSKFHDKFKPL
jgi:hypothetical protein